MRRNGILAAILLAGLLGGGAARAACGDGVRDPGEQCDDGAGNGNDNCCTAGCDLIDTDYDGTCDAQDPCPNGQGTYIKESQLKITRLNTGPGDDTIRLVGTLVVPNTPAIDPSASGMRLRMFASDGSGGTAVADVSLPGGSRWVERRANVWQYRDPRGSAGGITRVDVYLTSPAFPTTHLRKIIFGVTGRHGSWAVTPAMVTSAIDNGVPTGSALQVVVAMGEHGSATEQCGEVWYTTLRNTNCEFTATGDRVTCAGPPPVGPCRIGDPDDLGICDLLNAVRAEDRYFLKHQTYLAGSCDDLPQFVPSPGVACTVSASSTSFVVSASQGSAIKSCVWVSNPPPNGQNLTCS
jgi:hypothetical protein